MKNTLTRIYTDFLHGFSRILSVCIRSFIRVYPCILALIIIGLILPQTAQAATTRQISQFGITWTFDRDYEYGQFVNGDYWVVGPVTIIGINPPSVSGGRHMNGAMINPSAALLGSRHGFDSSVPRLTYDQSLNVALDVSSAKPLILQPNSSLVSSITDDDPDSPNLKLKTAAILTVLDEPAPSGSFRPAYTGTDKTIKFNKNQLNYSLLANLAITSQMHSIFPTYHYPYSNIYEYLDEVEGSFERPWLDHMPYWSGQYIHPRQNMEGYGNDIATQVSVGAAIMHLDFSNAEKEKLVVGMTQVGIDNYGAVKTGSFWEPDGGHGSGRKWPILFAGLILNDEEMKSIGQKSGDYLYSSGHGPGNPPDDYIRFGEDGQTFHVSQFDVDLEHYGDRMPYEQVDIGLPEWGIRHATIPIYDNKSWDASYRGMHNIGTWGGFILAAHIMEKSASAKTLWNNNALFDYLDRDAEIRGVSTRFLVPIMWATYRQNYGCIWTRDNPSDIYSNGHYINCSANLLYGDVNADAEISAFDAALAAHIAVDLEHPDIKDRAAAEVSGDSEVTAYDAALIAQRAVGLIDKFPIE